MATAYFEKLKDPRWQKKRLEALEHANWSCSVCFETANTLHVHHKQYFKGREPWEYDTDQLACLCAGCHESTHRREDKLLLASSYLELDGPASRDTAAYLIAGFSGRAITTPFNIFDFDAWVTGLLCRMLGAWGGSSSLSIHEKMRLADIAKTDVASINSCLRQFIGGYKDKEGDSK